MYTIILHGSLLGSVIRLVNFCLVNRFGSKKSRSDQNQHVDGITGTGMFGLTQLTSTTWAGNLLGIQVVVPERRDCSLHMLCKQGLNSWALEEPISETPSESIPLHEWVNPAGFVTNSLWVNCFKSTLQHIYIHIPSDTTSIAYASLKHSIRYNKYSLCIFKTFHQIQQVY